MPNKCHITLETPVKDFTVVWKWGSSEILCHHQTVVCVCLCLVTPLCSTLCDHMDCSQPGSSAHEDSPGKNTGVGAMPSSRGSSQPRDWTQISHITGGFFTIWATRKVREPWGDSLSLLKGIFPAQEMNQEVSPALQVDSLSAELPEKPKQQYRYI